jgi:hypothetical protein
MVQISNRLDFSTESYDDFSVQESAKMVLFRILFLLYIFIICLGYIKSCILLFS